MKLSLLIKFYHKAQLFLRFLSAKQQIKIASLGRIFFMKKFANQRIETPFVPDAKYSRKLWGIEFRSPIMNSAGMFKNGEGYDVIARMGAGAYIGGTSTANPRNGNKKNGVKLPFITLPNSNLAFNWLGLPNYGDEYLSKQVITKNKIIGCPIGWSVMRSPDFPEDEGVSKLIASLFLYQDHPQIDFIEINESCPNVKDGGGSIIPRLEIIAEQFLIKRNRNLPVIIKLSNDLTSEVVENLLPKIILLGFDGVNLGNTSTNYRKYGLNIKGADKSLFEYFSKNFGGGISGGVLKNDSLQICTIAAEVVAKMHLDREFHIIRSGGVENIDDIMKSEQCGCSLTQWYTGLFSAYDKFGEKLYFSLFRS